MGWDGYDFLTWASFPSSAKIVNDAEAGWVDWKKKRIEGLERLAVIPGSTLRIILKARQEGVPFPAYISHFSLNDSLIWRRIGSIELPNGTFDWRTFETQLVIPSDVSVVNGYLSVGAKGTVWFDDLEIFQDDKLIYSNDFSKWDPVIGAGVGAPIGGAVAYLLKEPLGPMVSEAVGAGLGGAVGGGIGLLSGLGIIPVPQIPIPTFGAAPEGPGAPARLGKYQITG